MAAPALTNAAISALPTFSTTSLTVTSYGLAGTAFGGAIGFGAGFGSAMYSSGGDWEYSLKMGGIMSGVGSQIGSIAGTLAGGWEVYQEQMQNLKMMERKVDNAINSARESYNSAKKAARDLFIGEDFYGVKVRFTDVFSENYASYFGGAINTPKSVYLDYKQNGLDSPGGRLLMHEYGHHLQRQSEGAWYYYTKVAPASVYNIHTLNPSDYNRSWTEVDANKRAFFHFARYYKKWNFKRYPIFP